MIYHRLIETYEKILSELNMEIEQSTFEIKEPEFTQCGEFKKYHQTKSSKAIPKQIENTLLKYAKTQKIRINKGNHLWETTKIQKLI